MTGRGERSVAVYGATGHTGRFVIAELLRRGLEPVAVARDGAKLAGSDLGARGVATRAASIDDAGALDHAFADVAAVINCAGPFLDTAAAVALGFIWTPMRAALSSTRLGTKPGRPDLSRGAVTSARC
jgi:short subunit dehydrogenase-like uncharacterized protein